MQVHTGESAVNLSTCQFVFEGENTWPCSAEAAKRVLEFQGHQAAYDLTPALGVALPLSPATRHCCLCSHDLDDCLFPGAWNGGGGNAAGPGRLNPCPEKQKRLNEAFQTRSCQLQLKASRWSTDARSHWLHRISRARVGGEDVLTLLRSDNGWTLWLAKGRRCVVG